MPKLLHNACLYCCNTPCRYIKKANEEYSKGSLQPTLYAIYFLDKALNKLEQQRPSLKFIDNMPKDRLDSFEKGSAIQLVATLTTVLITQ
jgi:hypothetical protein